METMNSLATGQLAAPATISIGGGFVRIWRAPRGLQVEIPAVVIVDTRTQQYTAFGAEAAELEEKLPAHLQCIRPFFADELYDRYAFQALLRYAVDQDRASLSWQDRVLAPFRYSVVIAPTVSSLHAKWLRQAGWEVGIWPWRVLSPIQELVDRPAVSRAASSTAHLHGVIDVGFSAVRVYCHVGETELFAVRFQDGLRSFYERLSEFEYAQTQLRFPPTVFYDQRWFVKHPVFDERTQRAKLEMVTKKHFEVVLHAYADELATFIVQHVNQLPESQRALLQQRGWTLVGGGAKLTNLAEQLQDALSMPVQVKKYAQYWEFPHA